MANTYLAYGQSDSGGAQYPPAGVITSLITWTIFLDGYAGIGWAKSIFAMLFYAWAPGQSTPYSGQLYPTGSAFTQNGQASPLG